MRLLDSTDEARAILKAELWLIPPIKSGAELCNMLLQHQKDQANLLLETIENMWPTEQPPLANNIITLDDFRR